MFRIAIILILAALTPPPTDNVPPSFWAVRPVFMSHFCWGHAKEARDAIAACTQRVEEKSLGSVPLAEALTQRGFLYTHNGEPVMAIRDYDAALRLQPDYWPALFYRAVAYERLGRHELAIWDLRRVIKLQPWYLRAIALFNESRGSPLDASPDVLFDNAIRSRMMCRARPEMRQVCPHDLFLGAPPSSTGDLCFVCKNLH
jgi:tetratricopeptide (TPR) repeat protein